MDTLHLAVVVLVGCAGGCATSPAIHLDAAIPITSTPPAEIPLEVVTHTVGLPQTLTVAHSGQQVVGMEESLGHAVSTAVVPWASVHKSEASADLRKKENEHAVAEEQAKLDTLNAETAAAVRVTKARAEAKEAELMAVAHAAEKRSEATTLTPLMVMMHAYDALSKLGGEGTHIMLGDWSKVPNFLIPANISSMSSFKASR